MTYHSKISSFRGELRWLSNFWPCTIVMDDGIIYPSVEHAYQAYKTLDMEERRSIAKLPAPGMAKKRGRYLTLRPDWDQVRCDVMNQALEAKFVSNPELTEKLLLTAGKELVEGNEWHDNYWGNCTCARCGRRPGKNMLGKLIMAIREEVLDEEVGEMMEGRNV